MKWTCGKCTMSFHVGMPVSSKPTIGEWQRCPECFVHFYSGRISSEQVIICSIKPETFRQLKRGVKYEEIGR